MVLALVLLPAIVSTVSGVWHSNDGPAHHSAKSSGRTSVQAPAEAAPSAGVASGRTTAPGNLVTAPTAAKSSKAPKPAAAPTKARAAALTAGSRGTEPTEEECPSICKGLARTPSTVLPNVLVVGDEISQGYFHIVQGLLQQVASVQHASLFTTENADSIPDGVCGTSVGALACVDTWLGGKGTVWHVVVFNWGLRDVAPDVDVAAYVTRIKQLYVKIFPYVAETGAAVWLSSTPTPPGDSSIPNSKVDELNQGVEAMWKNSSKPPEVDDLYHVVEHACHANTTTRDFPESAACAQLQDPSTHRFNAFGNQFIGMHVAEVIRGFL